MAYTKYSLTPANNTAAPPDGAPEGMLPSAVNDTMRDMMAQIRDCGDGIRDGTYTMTAAKITGGTITGITDLAIADGGTGASTAAAARTNLGLDGFVNMKNRIINGAMVIDQRNAGASVTINNTIAYTVDRWNVEDSTDGVLSVQQVVDAPDGFYNSLRITVTTADSSLGATQWAKLLQPIEAYNVTDLDFGLSTAKTITVSFWVKSSLTGTFGASVLNSAENRCFPFSYVINAANTWEYKTVTIPGDTTGTWGRGTNLIGLRLVFGLGVGSTYSGTAGAWTSSSFIYSVTGSVNLINTLNATWQVTGVQLEVGSTATSFDYRPYGTELALCQRYYERMSVLYFTTAWNSIALPAPYKVQKRASPTVTNTPDGGTGGVYATYLATNLTAGTDVVFQTVGNSTATGGSIQLSAEL